MRLEGMQSWTPARNAKGLFDQRAVPPPLPGPATPSASSPPPLPPPPTGVPAQRSAAGPATPSLPASGSRRARAAQGRPVGVPPWAKAGIGVVAAIMVLADGAIPPHDVQNGPDDRHCHQHREAGDVCGADEALVLCQVVEELVVDRDEPQALQGVPPPTVPRELARQLVGDSLDPALMLRLRGLAMHDPELPVLVEEPFGKIREGHARHNAKDRKQTVHTPTSLPERDFWTDFHPTGFPHSHSSDCSDESSGTLQQPAPKPRLGTRMET